MAKAVKPPGSGPGRPRGSKNKVKVRLEDAIRKRYPNYNPIFRLIDLADDPESSRELQMSCHATVAKYIHPQLRAVEVKGDSGGPIQAVLNVTVASE